MTIITKALTEKKADKKKQALFVEENAAETSKRDPEAQRQKSDVGGHFFVSRRSIHHIHVTATFSLFLVALMILIIGVIGGLYIYRQCARTQLHRLRTGWYSIPYDNSNKAAYTKSGGLMADLDLLLRSSIKNTQQEPLSAEKNADSNVGSFKEQFEFDLENEQYEKIDVPDFHGGRQGRFIHDFSVNKTGIVDVDGQCCFVMPLNRQTVLAPRNMYDLLRKIINDYYDIDTEIVRETMKIVTPPITDLSVVGAFIAHECQDLPTYMLKKVDSNVVKRSISSGVFGQFAGKNIIEFDILNLDDIEAYKKSSKD